jgi:hypothetical protein
MVQAVGAGMNQRRGKTPVMSLNGPPADTMERTFPQAGPLWIKVIHRPAQ